MEGTDSAVSSCEVAGVLHALLSPRAQFFKIVCMHAEILKAGPMFVHHMQWMRSGLHGL
jgi:hypothetical protein